jgi:hypothetical protein
MEKGIVETEMVGRPVQATCSSETLENFSTTTRHQNTEDKTRKQFIKVSK